MYSTRNVVAVIVVIGTALSLAWWHQSTRVGDVFKTGAPAFRTYLPDNPVKFAERYPDVGFAAEWLRPQLEAYAGRIVPNRVAKGDKVDAPVKAEGN
jgi:hypothetical protein